MSTMFQVLFQPLEIQGWRRKESCKKLPYFLGCPIAHKHLLFLLTKIVHVHHIKFEKYRKTSGRNALYYRLLILCSFSSHAFLYFTYYIIPVGIAYVLFIL